MTAPRKPGILLFALAAFFAIPRPVVAEVHDLAVDVPSRLGVVDFTTTQIVRSVDSVYSSLLSLPSGAAPSALHRRPDGTWLLAFAQPFTSGATTYEPRDIAMYNGSTFSMFLTGSAVGIPPGSRVDALFLDDATGNAVLSFNAPTRLGGTDYAASDLVRYAGAFSLYWAAATAGVPPGSNLCGAGVTSPGQLVVSFDVPTRLGAVDYLPGQLVRWTGGSNFVSYSLDPSWPPGSQIRDFAFAPPAGAVPESTGGGTPLRLGKAGGVTIQLSWGGSCVAADTDYEIYEGALGGTFSSHAPKACTTGGATSSAITPLSGSAYYLVVPRNAAAEGSYGTRSGAVERPPSASACLPREIKSCN